MDKKEVISMLGLSKTALIMVNKQDKDKRGNASRAKLLYRILLLMDKRDLEFLQDESNFKGLECVKNAKISLKIKKD